MGHGSYTSADWARLAASKGITSTSHEKNLFKAHRLEPEFDPRFIAMRQSRDSEQHPASTPIILGLDVTGSMGYLAAEIARKGLHETMMKLFSEKPVPDPQILFAAVGDCTDNAPLQVTQFESDIRIAQQLLRLWLEGNGADDAEDYELLWYFAAYHTSADAWEKHGRKGFLFTIGDADCHTSLSRSDILTVFNEKSPKLKSAALAEAAGEKFHVFHIHIQEKPNEPLPRKLSAMLPGRVLPIEKRRIRYLPELIVSVMMLVAGVPRERVEIAWSEPAALVVRRALDYLVIETDGEVSL